MMTAVVVERNGLKLSEVEGNFICSCRLLHAWHLSQSRITSL